MDIFTLLGSGETITIACSITPLPLWIYFTSENSIWRPAQPSLHITWLAGKSFPVSNALMHLTHFIHSLHSSYAQVTNATLRQGTADKCYVKRQVSIIGAGSAISLSYRNQVWVRVLSRQNLARVIQTGHLRLVQEWRLSVSRVQDFAERARVTKLDFFSNS